MWEMCVLMRAESGSSVGSQPKESSRSAVTVCTTSSAAGLAVPPGPGNGSSWRTTRRHSNRERPPGEAQQRRAHDERQRRVPGASNVEKRLHTRRIDHVGEQQAGPEDDADNQAGNEISHFSLR